MAESLDKVQRIVTSPATGRSRATNLGQVSRYGNVVPIRTPETWKSMPADTKARIVAWLLLAGAVYCGLVWWLA